MKKLRKALTIIFIIGIIAVTVWYFLKVPSLKIAPEKIIENYKKENYSGVVVEKYIDDQQHGYHKVILMEKDEERTILLDDDISGLFNYIKKGDSLEKSSGSLRVKLKRRNLDTLITMKFFGQTSN
ncbi:MAG: hypothetical protein AAF717_08355 [Bacteroidota bacterium]